MEKGKLAVFIGVAALHVAAVSALKHSIRQPVHRNNTVYAVWVVSDAPVDEQTESKPVARQAVRAMRIPAQRHIPDTQPQESNAPLSLPDWETTGDEAVSAAITQQARENAQRDLYPEPKAESLPNHPAPLFKTPLYDNGDSQRLDDGELNTWIGPECYATNRPQSMLSMGRNQLNVVCKGNAGKRKANDKLFDHLRPDYLRDAATAVAP
jgi:hypothetical protein